MADPSLSTNISITTSNSLKDEDEGIMVSQEPILRPRPRMKNLPKIDEVDSKYKEIILALPKEQGWLASTLRRYKGFWCLEQMLPGILAMEEKFKARSTDIIVTSFMKSGTTWLKALTFAIVHRKKYAFSSHPLLKLNPHDCVPIMDFHYTMGDDQYLETLPSPRVLGTHNAYSVLPESIKASKCRMVYICREPKDVAVSLWHMIAKFDWIDQKQFSFNQFFELFCKGQTPNGPLWGHVLEYYMESLNKTDKILFLKYEEMMKDPIDGVIKIAEYVECPFTEEEVKNGVVKKIVELCSFNNLKDYDVNKNGIGTEENNFFFRKAVVGDWQNYMTAEMAAKLDEIIKEKFQHSGFSYGAASID